jgi:dolichol-phosphate mannosyltransferase
MILMQKIRIILPTYNEKKNLKILIPTIFKIFEKNKLDGDILIIDDNSPDKTADFVEEMKKNYPIKLIKRKSKRGLGSAYIEGFKNSLKENKDIIFQMDADLSHKPKYIIDFIKKIDEGYDIVIGKREKFIGWGIWRKAISRGGNLIGKYIAGINIDDLTTGYRAYKKEVLNSINLKKIESNGYAFQLETLYRSISNGFEVGSIPIIFTDRESGKSKLSKWDVVEFFILALKIRLRLIDV